jgi:hypothetical protein
MDTGNRPTGVPILVTDLNFPGIGIGPFGTPGEKYSQAANEFRQGDHLALNKRRTVTRLQAADSVSHH